MFLDFHCGHLITSRNFYRIGNEKLHNTLRFSGKMSNNSLYLFVTVGAVGIAADTADGK
jgi:hypothetical protein